ncbi:MAG: protein phosphatase 2C domain-containing protein [Nocardioides sp.]|nr:protein phosphatase 2C domain-containing protein [Nocardioides sp.]
MALTLRYAALSDVGRVRKDNQDAGLASEHVLVVADGVGGAVRGDLASSTAVQAMRRLEAPVGGDMLEAMAGAFHRAHDRIAELVEEDPELEGTSTTVTAALFDGARLAIGHLGDSRAYLFRDGEISQLTKDHTFVQSLVDEGRITEEESRTHPHRNLILRAVDAVHETDPDLFYVELQSGDRVMLCSDGCSGSLDDARLADILGTGTVDYSAVELVRAALDAGSSDNVTAVVADVIDPAAAAAVDPETDAAATTGAMLVGAAAEQPRKPGPRGLFRGHRAGDTGELEPVPGSESTGRGLPFLARGDDAEPGHDEDEEVDPEELRYAPRPPRRLTWLKRLALVVVLLALLAGALKIAYDWSQEQYFVAADGEQVSIYRGITAELPGVDLSSVHEPTGIRLASLPEYRARQVREGIEANSLTDARAIVSRLDDLATECERAVQEDATASPQEPDGSPTAGTRTRTAEPSPTPEPSPTVAPQAGDCEDLP